jgi:hypothetical protein
MRLVHGFLAALVMLGSGISPAPAKADAAAQKFLEGIYQRYVGPDTPGIALDSKETLLSLFTPELAAMIAADSARAEQESEPPALDGDPFVFAQDWDIKNVAVAVKDTAPGKATGIVNFTNFGEKRTIELSLVKLPAGWRVDEIRWSDGTLRGILTGEGSGKDENGPRDTQKL